MEDKQILQNFRELLQDYSQRTELSKDQPNRIDVYIDPEDLLFAIQKLRNNNWGYLITISAYDTTDKNDQPQIGLVYHFGEENCIGNIRMFLPHNHRVVDSICPIIPSATLYERECMELYGIDMKNTPDRSKLLLAENWPDGIYPMMKSFTGLTESQVTETGDQNE